VEVANMNIVIGPVLSRADGYAFDTWSAGKGLTRSYPYRRIDQAYYARNAEIKASDRSRARAAIVCQTLDEFIVKLTGDGCPIDNAYLAAGDPWLQRQLRAPVGLGDRPFVVGRRPVAGEGLPPRQPDLMLDDPLPFRLSRNHFVIEQRREGYHVRDLCSTLGTIVNGQPIGCDFGTDDVLLRFGENEVIAGGADSPFVFSVSIPGPLASPRFSQ
jgi:FHA domain